MSTSNKRGRGARATLAGSAPSIVEAHLATPRSLCRMLDMHGFAGSNAKGVKQALAKPMFRLGADIGGMDGFGRVVGSIRMSERILLGRMGCFSWIRVSHDILALQSM